MPQHHQPPPPPNDGKRSLTPKLSAPLSRSSNLRKGKSFTRTLQNDTYPFISARHANLSTRSVLITGGSKGVGLATAISYV